MEQMGEFDPETPLKHQYCQQLSLEEYDEQTVKTTHSALQNLMDFIEQNPEFYKKFVARKKTADEENSGLFAFLKVKLLTVLQGEDYALETISKEECDESLTNFQNEVINVFNYAQENNPKRFSRRLAARKRKQEKQSLRNAKKNNNHTAPPLPPPPPPLLSDAIPAKTFADDCENKENIGSPSHFVPKVRPSIRKEKKMVGDFSITSPPPPPPPPPPFALQDATNKGHGSAPCTPNRKPKRVQPMSEQKPRKGQIKRPFEKTASLASLTSIGSVQDELRSFKRGSLRSVAGEMSPGGTPFKTPRTRQLQSSHGHNDAIQNAFNIEMLDKFRNVRSPPSNGNSPAYGLNTSGFTP